MSDVELTRVKIERCNYANKAENNSGKDKDGIKHEKRDTVNHFGGTFESIKPEEQNYPQCTRNPESSYKCELCNKSFAAKKYLALHLKIHAEQPDELSVKSDYNVINNFNESEAIEIKSEFPIADTVIINYGEIHNDLTEDPDEKNKITDYQLTQIIKGMFLIVILLLISYRWVF